MLSTRETAVTKVRGGTIGGVGVDLLAVEEPLEIRLGYFDEGRRIRTLMVTMRTPGHDSELALGTLYSEGIVSDASQVHIVLDGRNQVRVELSNDVPVDWSKLERLSLANSSCGLCGKTSIESVERQLSNGFVVRAELLSDLPRRLRASQNVFDSTGGLHAAALFDADGEMLAVYEDVGRHNAVDKLVGAALMKGQLPLSDCVLLVSGRAGFEIAQKAIHAGVPVMAAIGAPSSLAVDLAREAGMTLAGFVRDGRYNIYSAPERLR